MCWLNHIEENFKFSFNPWFFAGISLGALVLIFLSQVMPFGTAAAFSGAFMACCGVFTIGRPMIRVGGYRNWYKNPISIDDKCYPTEAEKAEEDKQRQLDAIAVQIVGPALVIVGTMINGISGLF